MSAGKRSCPDIICYLLSVTLSSAREIATRRRRPEARASCVRGVAILAATAMSFAPPDADCSRRNRAAVGLLQWLRSEGADVARVQLKPDHRSGELGLHAAARLENGSEALRCPTSVALTAEAALADITIGSLRLDDEHRVLLYLLHCRRLGQASRWHAYIDSLPDEDEMLPRIPAFWPASELEHLLSGTPLYAQACATYASLQDFQQTTVEPELTGRHPGRFPPSSFGMRQLCWAHAIWHSRAIRLPLPGGPRECLVPLLDMMNHSTGLPSTVTFSRGGGSSAANTPGDAGASRGGGISGASFVVHVGRPTEAGEELHLNYGAKGNGELLRDHGFVMRDNMADVFELELSGLCEAGAGREERLMLLRGRGRHGPAGGATRQFLFRSGGLQGGGLPPQLLPTARVLCAEDGSELRDAVAAFAEGREGDFAAHGGMEHCASGSSAGGINDRGSGGGGGGGGNGGGGGGGDGGRLGDGEDDHSGSAVRQFDWSLVDWSAEDPFAEANEAVAHRLPCGEACERRTLEALQRLLCERREALPNQFSTFRCDERIQRERCEMARVYVRSMHTLLSEAEEEVARLMRALTTEHAGSATKRPRI